MADVVDLVAAERVRSLADLRVVVRDLRAR